MRSRCSLSAAKAALTAVAVPLTAALALLVGDAVCHPRGGSALAQSLGGFSDGDKDFEEMSRAEKDAAKAEARRRKFDTLRVCADPGNLPFSDNRKQGFENKIAEVIAAQLGAHVKYAWRPTFERGLTRQPMTELNLCDVMIDMPVDYEALLTTKPIYRTTYVLAYRSDRRLSIKSLDDPALKTLKVGVYETSGLRSALASHGVKNANVTVMATSHDADLEPGHQPWHQVEQVLSGQLDVAAVWGPFAGWVKTTQRAPLTLTPTNRMDDDVPMEFSLAFGVRRYDAVLKYALEDAMEARKADIAGILRTYGVPLVQCSDCLVSGTIPAHGDYTIQTVLDESADRPIRRSAISAAQVDTWLAEGASVDDELDNAVVAADLERVKYLLGKEADVNALGKDGEAPLHIAATNGDKDMVALLVDHGARIDAPDRDGFSPLALAAARGNATVIPLLVARGADTEKPIGGGYTPLFVAIGGGKLAAARALIEAGAKADVAEGPQKLTPLMAVATQKPPERRIMQVVQKVAPVDIAAALVKHGADVNAVSTRGVTALMIAAAHDNAPMAGVLIQAGAHADMKSAENQTAMDIARQDDSQSVVRVLQLLQ